MEESSLLDFAGKWKGKGEVDEILKELMNERHEAESREIEVD